MIVNSVGRFEIVNVTKAGSLTVKTTLKGEGEIGYYGSARELLVQTLHHAFVAVLISNFIQE